MKFGRKIFALVLASALTITGGVVFADGDGDTTATVDKVFVNFDDTGITSFADLTTKYGFQFSGTTQSTEIVDAPNSTARGKALKFSHIGGDSEGYDSVYLPFGNEATTGVYRISYDMYEVAETDTSKTAYYCQKLFVDLPNTLGTVGYGAQNLLASDKQQGSGKLTTSGTKEEGGRTLVGGESAYTYGAWRKIEHVVDLDKKVLRTIIRNDDDSLYGSVRAAFTSEYTTTPLLQSLKGISFILNYGDVVYIDNLKLQKMSTTGTVNFNDVDTIGELSDEYGFIYDGTHETAIETAPVDANGNGATYGKALKIGPTGGYAVYKAFGDKAMSDGIFKVSYMFYNYSNSNVFQSELTSDFSQEAGSMNLGSFTSGYWYFSNFTGAAGPLTAQTWYKVEQFVDLKNNKLTTAIYNADGTIVGNVATADIKALYDVACDTAKLRGISFRSHSATVYIDDLNVEEVNRHFIKNGMEAKNIQAGDSIQAVVSADEGKTCLITFYDADGNLLSVKMETIGAGNGNTWHSGAVTVPTGAASAKAYVWDLGKLSPLYDPLSL